MSVCSHFHTDENEAFSQNISKKISDFELVTETFIAGTSLHSVKLLKSLLYFYTLGSSCEEGGFC